MDPVYREPVEQGNAGAKPTRRAPYRLSHPTPARAALTLSAARAECIGEAAAFVEEYVVKRHQTLNVWAPALLMRHQPGVGKTKSLAMAINLHLRGWSHGEVLIVAPTHELLSEIEAELEVPAVHVYGRDETTCKYPEIAQAMRKRRLEMGELVCNKVCPARKGCRYYAQFDEGPLVWLVTPTMARSPRFRYAPDGTDVNGGEIMYHRGGSSAERWRLKTVPPVAFNQERQNLIEDGLDVQGGDVRSSAAGGARGRDERPGSGSGVWTAPGHGAQDAEVLGTSRVSKTEATGTTEAGPIQGGNRPDPRGGPRSSEEAASYRQAYLPALERRARVRGQVHDSQGLRPGAPSPDPRDVRAADASSRTRPV